MRWNEDFIKDFYAKYIKYDHQESNYDEYGWFDKFVSFSQYKEEPEEDCTYQTHYLGEWSYNDSNSVDAPIQNDIKRNPSPYEWYFRNGLDARVFITDEVNLPKCHEESLISFDDAMGFGGADGV